MTRAETERLAAPVVQAYRDCEDELLRLIGQQLGKYGRLSDTSKWRIRQLARAGEINREAVKIIGSYTKGVDAETYEAILAAAEGEVGRLDAAMLGLLSEGGAMSDDARGMLEAFERQSVQELNVQNAQIAGGYAEALTERFNLVNTVMAYKTGSAFVSAVNEIYSDRQSVIRELNAGAAAVVSGTESLQEATRRTIHRLAQKGIPGFVDKAGHEWSPEAYVKMDLRSTLGNTARAAQDARCDAYGISLIAVSSHMGARPKCAPYQGRIFSRDGTRGTTTDGNGQSVEYIPLSETSYGEPDGLFGINCGHQQYPFIPGVNIQRYYPYDEEQNAKVYEQTQQQRAMERKIRADKRECMMLQETGDEEGLKKASQRLRADKDKYVAFSKQTRLGVHNENTQVYGYDRSKSMKTVWAQKKALTGAASGGIIKNIELPAETDQIRSMSSETRSLISNAFDKIAQKYNYRLDELVTMPLAEKDKNVPFQFSPTKNRDGDFITRIIINSKYDFMGSQENFQKRIMKNFESGMLASDSVEGLIAHEVAHVMTFQDNSTFSGYLMSNRILTPRTVEGISRYADIMDDGSECIAEAFAAQWCGHTISDDAQKLLDEFIERYRK